jgi:hypothetical protein
MARSSEAATKAVRERLEALERVSCRGFAAHVLKKTRLVNVECRGIEIDSKTGKSVAGKDASVIVEHEIDIDPSAV